MRRFFSPVLLARLWLLLAAASLIGPGITASLTMDEAHAYHLFLNQKAEVLFSKFDAGYHVLQTWLSWLAVHRFGKSEPIIRLPSMLAGLAYLAAVYHLSRKIAGTGRAFLVGVVLLSANPLIHDHLSLARGYGMALAFFAWAIAALLAERFVLAGALLGLSLGSNFTFLIPAAAAIAAHLLIHRSGRIFRTAASFVLASLPFVAVPWMLGHRSDFSYGAESFSVSIHTLLSPSLANQARVAPAWLDPVRDYALPAILLAIAALATLAYLRRALEPAWFTATLLLSLASVLILHAAFDVAYPWARTGIYLIWLFLIASFSVWRWVAAQPGEFRIARHALAAVNIALALVFFWTLDPGFYYEFRDDAGIAAFMRTLRDRPSTERICIGGSWRFEPVVNYYRLRYRLDWIDEMQRSPAPESGCLYYVMEAPDVPYIRSMRLVQIQRDPISRSALAQAP